MASDAQYQVEDFFTDCCLSEQDAHMRLSLRAYLGRYIAIRGVGVNTDPDAYGIQVIFHRALDIQSDGGQCCTDLFSPAPSYFLCWRDLFNVCKL